MTKSKSNQPDANTLEASKERRMFLEKFGKLAVVTPIAVTALLSPATSAAPKSCRGNGNKSCN